MELKRILNYLQCPYCCGQKLILKNQRKIICSVCRVDFLVVEGVPIMMKKDFLGEQERRQLTWFDDHYSSFSKEKYQLENWRKSVLGRLFDQSWSQFVKKYLDIGCGATGYTVIEAAKRGWLSFGVDISIEAMLRAKSLAEKQKVASRTTFVVCSAEKLPFKKNLFDYVSILSVLEHLANDRLAMGAISQIVNKNGYCYVCVPNTYERMWPFLWPIYFYFDKKMGHKRHYSIEGLSQKMTRVGFRLQRVFYNGHLIKLLQLVLERLGFINDKNWWRFEKEDINRSSTGIQLNAIYKKT
jgi:ubiquinone/menaquinone biosynthesis C-methylase UbiE/uncharacterized protein YbaR (Trm112 family)